MTRAILFDLDGTLIDSRLDLARSTNQALREVGLPERPEAEIFGFIGEGSRRLIEKAVAPRVELLDAAHTAWAQAYSTQLLANTLPYPGIEGLLSRLPGPLAVHTNKINCAGIKARHPKSLPVPRALERTKVARSRLLASINSSATSRGERGDPTRRRRRQ